MRALRRRSATQDEGFGLILVLGIMAVIMGLVILSGSMASFSLKSSTQHVTFTQSMGAAESGIDQTLARLQRAYVAFGSDFPVPNMPSAMDPSPTCQADPANYKVPAGGFASQAAEKAWAQQAIATELAAQPNCLVHSSKGDYVVLKPSNRQVVYAMGFSPSYAAKPHKTRLIKSEYLFVPYKPSNAVLTGGNLELDASTTVTVAAGNDPTLAAVHSNGVISVPQGNPTVSGEVSSTGTSTASSNNFAINPSGKVTTTPSQPIPLVSALAVYNRWESTLHDSWYDLCPDGTIKHPSTAGPCATTDAAQLVANLGPGGADYGTTVRGFTWVPAANGQPAQWLVGKNVPDGVYYAYASNVNPASGAGNTVTSNATILAQAQDETTCQKFGGNINWDHNNIGAPLIPDLFMLADADLSTSSNFYAGSAGPPVVSGLFIAGDQINLQTSANGAYGAVIAADQCPPTAGETNVIKNPNVFYDPNAEAPFTDVINTTLWLEF